MFVGFDPTYLAKAVCAATFLGVIIALVLRNRRLAGWLAISFVGALVSYLMLNYHGEGQQVRGVGVGGVLVVIAIACGYEIFRLLNAEVRNWFLTAYLSLAASLLLLFGFRLAYLNYQHTMGVPSLLHDSLESLVTASMWLVALTGLLALIAGLVQFRQWHDRTYMRRPPSGISEGSGGDS